MELKCKSLTKKQRQIRLLIVLNGIEIWCYWKLCQGVCFLLIVLNGIEITKNIIKTRGRHLLLIVLNGIEIVTFAGNIITVELLIVLNGIEISNDRNNTEACASFNRTKWN